MSIISVVGGVIDTHLLKRAVRDIQAIPDYAPVVGDVKETDVVKAATLILSKLAEQHFTVKFILFEYKKRYEEYTKLLAAFKRLRKADDYAYLALRMLEFIESRPVWFSENKFPVFMFVKKRDGYWASLASIEDKKIVYSVNGEIQSKYILDFSTLRCFKTSNGDTPEEALNVLPDVMYFDYAACEDKPLWQTPAAFA